MSVGSLRICDALLDIPTGELVGQKPTETRKVSQEPLALLPWCFRPRPRQIGSDSDWKCWICIFDDAFPIALHGPHDPAVGGKQSQVGMALCKFNCQRRIGQ